MSAAPALQLGRHALQPILAGDVARTDGGVAREVDIKQNNRAHTQVAHIARRVAVVGHRVATKPHHEHLRHHAAQLAVADLIGRNKVARHQADNQ